MFHYTPSIYYNIYTNEINSLDDIAYKKLLKVINKNNSLKYFKIFLFNLKAILPGKVPPFLPSNFINLQINLQIKITIL